MIYSELVKSTEAIFDREIRVPNNINFENQILNERWVQTRATKVYDYRRWQLRQMGFQQFDLKDIIALMYGVKPNKQHSAKDKHPYEWVLNHQTGKNDKKRWVHHAEYFGYYRKAGWWNWPPWAGQKAVWKCKVANLNELSCEVPPGIVLKILRLKPSKLFNVFHVIEPVLPKNTTKKPVLLGTVWELPPQFNGMEKDGPVYNKAGYIGHFFLSEWD